MLSFSICQGSTASLKDLFLGDDKFKIGLIFERWTAAIKGFDLKCLKGGAKKGPITKPFLIQVAKVSVIHFPFSIAEFVFFATTEGSS